MTQALVDLLEAVPEGDRKLDAAVAVSLFETVASDGDLVYAALVRSYDYCEPGMFWRVSRSGRSLQTAPPYTTSVDTAMTAIPEGESWDCGWESANPHGIAWVGANNSAVTAATPALALCAAILKARAGG